MQQKPAPLEDEPILLKPALAQIDDLEELKTQYRVFSDAVLLKWIQAVTGSHRTAMAAVLRERGHDL